MSEGLGRLVAGAVPPLLPTLIGALVAGVLLLVGLSELSGIILFAPAAALLLSGVASKHPHGGRFDWVVPPVLRGTEYLYLFSLGYGAGVPGPLVFVLMTVVVLHHCGIVHWTRCGARPAAWTMRAMLGWDGRMLLAAIGGAAGLLPFTYGVLAGYLAVLLAREAAAAWLATPIATAVDVAGNERGGVDASTT